MTATNFISLACATAAFIAAAAAAKFWAVSAGNWVWLCLTLLLYTAGNLIMVRLIREMGMGVALSLSAVIQLSAINLLAIALFGERMSAQQGTGIVLAIVAVALITLPAGGR